MSWENAFQTWAKPPGETEQAKCDNAVRTVQNAIEASSTFTHRSVRVFPQGSYHNRTNVRADSDVDVAVLCTDTFYYELPAGKTAMDFGITPARYSFPQFKNDVEGALESYFGANSVTRGNKAFDLHENSYRVDADVVACFPHRRYHDNGVGPVGTEFVTDRGLPIINWPEQSYDNGVAKNEATGRRFKAVVRILKTLRGKMLESHIASAGSISSFLLESLVWNVPEEAFGHNTYTADIRWALARLFNATLRWEDCKEWGEINELKYLFWKGQPWTWGQAHAFVSDAWKYLGFE